MRGILQIAAISALVLCTWCAHAHASGADSRDPVEDAADTVTRAVDAKDDVPVRRAAVSTDADPWLVVDGLLARGRRDAAQRLADAVPGIVGDSLRARVPEAKAADARTRTALRLARVAACSRDWTRTIAIVDGAAAALGEDAPSLALRAEKARAAAGSRRHADAARFAGEVATDAESIGWWTLAVRERHRAALETLYVSPREAASRWRDLERLAVPVGDPRIRATALEGLATTQERSGDTLGAIDSAEQALRLREELRELGPWARAEASLGALLLRAGRTEEAREALEHARVRADIAGDAPTIISALAGLGTLRLVAGEAALAVPLLERAVALARQRDQQEQAARVLVNLATARRALGETASALEDMRAAEDLFQRTGDVQGSVWALLTGALLRADVGDVEGALKAGESALRLARSSGDRDGEALACTQLACGLMAAGECEEGARLLDEVERGAPTSSAVADATAAAQTARRVAIARRPEELEKALRIVSAARDAARARGDGRGVARFLVQEGALRVLARDGVGALAAYDAAVREADFLHDARLLASALAGVAQAHLAAGDPQAALRAARDAVSRLEPMVRGLGDEEGAFARAAWKDVFEVGAAAAVTVANAGWEHWFLESGRAGALLEALGGRELLRSLEAPAALLEAVEAARREESVARSAVDGAVAANQTFDEIRAMRAAADEAARRLVDAEAAVERRKKAALGFYPRPATLEAVRAALGKQDALVVYGTFGDRWGALVADSSGARHVVLGTIADVRAATAFDPAADAPVAAKALASARRALVQPLGLPASVRRVLVVPCDDLAYVPFAALLPDDDVAFLPSGTAWLRLREGRRLTGSGVLALGDPVYGAGPGDGVRGAVLAALPATRIEATAVGDVTLLGADATVPRLRHALTTRPRWRAVHLACHGVLDATQPSLSALYVTATTEHDGRLRPRDLLGESFSADLVVLSACETARGTTVRAEGVLGLCRAVMHAGAPRVVASLWKVDDEATRVLMTDFHARWKAGTPAARALREAQTHVRSQSKWSHPRFWAAWVLWGLPE